MGRSFEELRDDAVDAFEESTGDLPNDYEMAIIEIGAQEMVEDGTE